MQCDNFQMIAEKKPAIPSAEIIERIKKMNKAKLQLDDLWKDTDLLIREYISKYGSIEISMENEKKLCSNMTVE